MAAPGLTNEDECVASIEELIGAFGLKCFMLSLAQTSAADAPKAMHQQMTLRAIHSVIREIVYAKNSKLNAQVIAIGSGFPMSENFSMTSVAAEHGISRAAVSKRALKFCDENNLPPSIYMKSAKDRRTYTESNGNEKLPSAI